jgi:thiosulfate reductase cytochrome b subunit
MNPVAKLGEGEMLAVIFASIIITGISLLTANVFFQTEGAPGEWQLLRRYIKACISLVNNLLTK